MPRLKKFITHYPATPSIRMFFITIFYLLHYSIIPATAIFQRSLLET